MTIEEAEKIAEYCSLDYDYRETLTNEQSEFAARCIRAVIQATETPYDENGVVSSYDTEFFQHVITGANEHG